ncbi:Caspase-7 [Bulinus truncatus]|nr:Caspase-7 [Bulinus truncatus]
MGFPELLYCYSFTSDKLWHKPQILLHYQTTEFKMESRHKERIQKNFTKLVEQISPGIEEVCSSLLHEHNIINKRMWEDIIEENKGASKRSRKLLQLLLSRGPNAFQKLYESVISEELYDAADTLMPENMPHWKSDTADDLTYLADVIKNPNDQLFVQHLWLNNTSSIDSHINNCTDTMVSHNPLSKQNGELDVLDRLQIKDIKDLLNKDFERSAKKYDTGSFSSPTEVKELETDPSQTEVKELETDPSQTEVKELETDPSQTQVKELETGPSQTQVKELETDPSQTKVKELETDPSQTQVKELETGPFSSQMISKNTLSTSTLNPAELSEQNQIHRKENVTYLKSPVPTVDLTPVQLLDNTSENLLTELHVLPKPPQVDVMDWITKKNRSIKLVDMNSEMAQKFKQLMCNPDGSIYIMKNKIRGNAVIIDNIHFDHKTPRAGSKKDTESLKNVFSTLSFNTRIHTDLTGRAMLQVLEDECQMIEEKHECFILAILSHGTNGFIYGTDGDKTLENAISVERIRDIVCKVKNLINKPKLFFIQACRGDIKDPGLEEADNGKVPTHADCVFAMSTTSAMASWRDPKHGTWFIQAVAKIFSEHAHNCDINKLMTHVNNLVSQRETKTSERVKQVSEFSNTLRKTLYFFPGLNEENIATMVS